MANNINKYRVHEVAKDFGLQTREIIDILGQYFDVPKKSGQNLDERELTVRQNRGMRNCPRTPEVRAFEDLWLSWVRAGAPRDSDGKPICTKAIQARMA